MPFCTKSTDKKHVFEAFERRFWWNFGDFKSFAAWGKTT